jgi:hypothetical protein
VCKTGANACGSLKKYAALKLFTITFAKGLDLDDSIENFVKFSPMTEEFLAKFHNI